MRRGDGIAALACDAPQRAHADDAHYLMPAYAHGAVTRIALRAATATASFLPLMLCTITPQRHHDCPPLMPLLSQIDYGCQRRLSLPCLRCRHFSFAEAAMSAIIAAIFIIRFRHAI